MSRRCHPSRPPIPEECEVNRLHAEAVKKRKEAAEAAAVIANFHRQRVIPLTERSLPIFGLTPEVLASGSRTSMVLLPRGIATRRARNAVAEFPNDTNNL